MGQFITDPPGIPVSILKFQLVDMFTAGSTNEMRDAIIKEFCQEDTRLRVIIATCAFGLGIDIPDIVRVVNWGSPNTLEDLVQQSGRAGRNGISAESILIYKNPGRNVSNAVKEYEENTVMCHRMLLYKDFLFNCVDMNIVNTNDCCDLCAVRQ